MPESRSPILILSSIPAFTRNLVWAAGLAGKTCWVMDGAGPAGEWQRSPGVLGVETIDAAGIERASEPILDQLFEFLRRHEVAAVVAADTRCSRLLLRARPDLPATVRCFPMTEPDCFERLYDKGRFADLLRESGLPGPQTQTIRALAETEDLSVPFPVIVKPTQGEGGEGIETASTSAALSEALRARSDLREAPVVVQAFVPGRDIDLSLLADHGRCVAWTIQEKRERGVMRFVERDDLLELGHELVTRTGYHGVMHLDMRIDERNGSVVFIEANPRFWGSLCYSVWSGVNFLDLGLRLAAGEDIGEAFAPVFGDCPYLAVTRRSLPRLLLGGWPLPRGLDLAQRRAWSFHHRGGPAALRSWLAHSGPSSAR